MENIEKKRHKWAHAEEEISQQAHLVVVGRGYFLQMENEKCFKTERENQWMMWPKPGVEFNLARLTGLTRNVIFTHACSNF